MNEHVIGHDPFNEKWQSPEAHMTRFSELLQGLSLVRFKYTRHKRDGSQAVVTSYHGVVDHQDLQLVATARTQALLAGLVETFSPLVAATPTGKDSPSSRCSFSSPIWISPNRLRLLHPLSSRHSSLSPLFAS